ncbi:Hypothetical protein Y17_0405 [Pectobacterium wasabiae CFBP 3304]|nr:Hypothetical protein Y17_0405 [Pectobacterium wasabiae CFBP 3304]
MYPFQFRWTKCHEDFCISENIFLQHVMVTKGVYKTRNLFRFEKGKKSICFVMFGLNPFRLCQRKASVQWEPFPTQWVIYHRN